MNIQLKIREFIESELGIDIKSLSDTDPLYTSGIIDSFAFIEMLSFLENLFETKIDLADLSLDELDSIDSLSKLKA